MNIKGFQTKDGIEKVDFPGGIAIKLDESLAVKDGVLSVNTTDQMEQDNTQPISSAGVYAAVGNIAALLETI